VSSPLTIKILPCDEYGNFAYKGKQRKRKNVVITLDPELLEKAHKLGLNISKVCEKALIQAVKALEQVFSQNKGGNLGTVGSWWWTRRDYLSRLNFPEKVNFKQISNDFLQNNCVIYIDYLLTS